MPEEEEDCCLSDALLPDVLARGQKERQKFRSLANDPEENWLDGFVAGCFVGIFMMPPITEPFSLANHEEDFANHRTEPCELLEHVKRTEQNG